MPTGETIGPAEGLNDATAAFQASMDAESPSRSIKGEERRRPAKQEIEDIFPQRDMDRSEPEGGGDEDPEPVKRARREANEHPPRDPDEEIDPDEEDDEDLETGEEPQDEEPEEPDEDEEEPESAGLDPDQIVRIIVDGEPTEVSVGEMTRGYIRQETFHRRMGELGQGVQALHAAKRELDALYEAHVQRTQELEALVGEFMPKEPDWNQLRQHDPAQAANLRFEWEDIQRKIAGVYYSRQAAQQALHQQQLERLQQYAQAGRARLATAHPEWKAEKVWRRDSDSMNRTAREAGYTDEEIQQLYDPRAVEILLKASRYDRMMAAKPKPVRTNGPSPTKINQRATPSRNVQRSFDRAERRLSRSGSIDDASRVFERMLDREG